MAIQCNSPSSHVDLLARMMLILMTIAGGHINSAIAAKVSSPPPRQSMPTGRQKKSYMVDVGLQNYCNTILTCMVCLVYASVTMQVTYMYLPLLPCFYYA